MEGWAEGIQNAVQYMEDNITEELDIGDIAARAYVSPFHFQRIFSVLCGFTVGEYIRSRRLTLAAQELSTSDRVTIIQELRSVFAWTGLWILKMWCFSSITALWPFQPLEW